MEYIETAKLLLMNSQNYTSLPKISFDSFGKLKIKGLVYVN